MKNRFTFLDDSGLRKIFDLLRPEGGAFVVGGAVRNAILGVPAKDIDISTPVVPEHVSRLAERAGIRVIPTGIEHGTVTLMIDAEPYEITTFRKEVALGAGRGGRSAAVTWASDLHDDAIRRDFTMNALYVDEGGRLIDMVEGEKDANDRRIRFVGDADMRIMEDRLRAVRLFRFWADYGDPNPETHREAIDAAARFAQDLGALSRERVGWEVRRIMGAKDPSAVITEMARSGMLESLMPGADSGRMLAACAARYLAAQAPCWITMVAASRMHDPANALKLSRDESRAIDETIMALRLDEPAQRAHLYGSSAAKRAAVIGLIEDRPLPHGWEKEVERGENASFPLKAVDFPHLQGAALGAALKSAKRKWLDGGMYADREDILREDSSAEPGW